MAAPTKVPEARAPSSGKQDGAVDADVRIVLAASHDGWKRHRLQRHRRKAADNVRGAFGVVDIGRGYIIVPFTAEQR